MSEEERVEIDAITLLRAGALLPLEAAGLPLGYRSVCHELNQRYARQWSAEQWLAALGPALWRYRTPTELDS